MNPDFTPIPARLKGPAIICGNCREKCQRATEDFDTKKFWCDSCVEKAKEAIKQKQEP